jgi:hypothetical protein
VDSALVATTRRVPCPGRAGRPISRERLERFAAIAAVTCDVEARTIDGAVWAVAIRRVAESGVPRLAAALRLPSERRHGTATCTADIELLPPLYLVDKAGRYVVPPVPLDVCDHPLQDVIRAVNAVGWREVSAHRQRQMVSPDALAARCPMKYKNMAYIDARYGRKRSSGGPIVEAPPLSAHVCVYRVTTRDHEVGSFVRGLTLRRKESARLAQALTGPGPARACPDVRDFAVIAFTGGPAPVVELGGCWRVDRPVDGIGTADAREVNAILGRS